MRAVVLIGMFVASLAFGSVVVSAQVDPPQGDCKQACRDVEKECKAACDAQADPAACQSKCRDDGAQCVEQCR